MLIFTFNLSTLSYLSIINYQFIFKIIRLSTCDAKYHHLDSKSLTELAYN